MKLKFFELGFLVALGATITLAFSALFGGTILWIIWPFALPVVFPNAIASGIIIAKLPWWTAVCTVWVFNILIKTHVNKEK